MRVDEAGAFAVAFTMLSQNGNYRINRDLLVVATSLERALELVRELHPDAQIHAANRKGSLDAKSVVIDPTLTAAPAEPYYDTLGPEPAA